MKPRRRILPLLLGLWVALQTVAQTTNGVSPSPHPTRHCLWEVQGSNTVYLLGSLHVMKPDLYPLAPALEAAYAQAGIVGFETDLEALKDPAMTMKLMQAGMYSGTDTLKNHLPAATHALIVSHLESAVGSAAPFEKFKPWMVAVTMLEMELMQLGYHPEQGLDLYFSRRARHDYKPVIALETPELQIQLLAGLGELDGTQFLQQTLLELKTLKTDFDTLTGAWRTGDLAALERLLHESFAPYPRLRDRFLTDRNRAWIPELEKLLRGTTNALVVVGAGHLVGTNSVVDLLKARGYRVQQR